MKIIKVQYTVKDDFIETNKKNIKEVMEELKELDKGVKYFASNKGNSFVHIVVLGDDDPGDVIPNLVTFGKFREALQKGAETKPESEEFTLVDSSFDFT